MNGALWLTPAVLALALASGCFAPVTEGKSDGGTGGGSGGSTGGSGGSAGGGAAGGGVAGQWVTRAPLKVARAEFATAVFDGRIYTFGGTTGSTVGIVEVYDPGLNEWAFGKSMPTPRRMAVAGVIGDRIYVVGGFKAEENLDQITYTNVTEAYDPATNTWTTRAPPPFPVAFNTVLGNQFAAAAVLDGKLRVLLFDTQGNKAYDYDPGSDQWAAVQPPAPTVDAMQTALCQGALYVLSTGRWMGRGGDFTRLTPGPPDFWSNLAPLRPPSTGGSFVRRELAALAGTSSAVVAIGGAIHDYAVSAPTVVGSLDVFDLGTLSWKSAAPMLHPRQSLGAVSIGNTVYAIGGSTGPFPTQIVPVPWVESFTVP